MKEPSVALRDPDVCRCGSHVTHVLERRRAPGYLRRRHECCTCEYRWNSYQTLIDPKKITFSPATRHYG